MSRVRVTTGVVDRDVIRVGRSRIQGTGVFAKRRIPKGARTIEYTGARNCQALSFDDHRYRYSPARHRAPITHRP